MPGVGEEKTPDEIFLEFDADDSGEIDKSELVLALGNAGVTVTTAQVDKLMSIIDTDNDEFVSSQRNIWHRECWEIIHCIMRVVRCGECSFI